MKKRLICSIVLIMFSFLFISNVEAAITCTYYPREAFDGEKIKDDNIKKMFSLLFFILQNVFNMVVEVPRWTNAKMEV